MIGSKLIQKVLGSRNTRVIRRFKKIVDKINLLEESMQALSDEQLKAKTGIFKERLKAGETLDDLLPEAFAVVRETSVRVLQMRHFDVQLIGGIVLHQGNIAEMRTGEGKTLVSTLPAYLNALTGQGVHIITVNDYLVQRDEAWMRPIYEFLGLSTGVIVADMNHEARKSAYQADIVCGTNNEFGFDYLRDNMAFTLEERVQRVLNFAVVDEVDSILIDEARTPLIISGIADDVAPVCQAINTLVPELVRQDREGEPGDYSVDEKGKQVFLTEDGHQKVETLLQKAGLMQGSKGLYDLSNIALMHHFNAALRAHILFQRDVDYIVDGGEVIIIDEHTGRKMTGRRWSDGLHQAVEAKEGVKIQHETQTLASITFQNFFRLYNKLSGMTGTADTEAYEFQDIYALEVVVIPTNKPMIRDDAPDLVYLNQMDKFNAIVEDIKTSVENNQPVLVGTASIETSELLSKHLNKAKVKHQVLNAKFHEKEAHIIAQAGCPGAVTIATNMAGRGTDIVLGGNLEAELDTLKNPSPEQTTAVKENWKERHKTVLEAGGLRIVGTERHESRRIDNQLRGRSGRQGDPGSSRFYLSLEDNLLRIFAADRLTSIMQRVGMQEGDALESPLLTRCIEGAQRKVEGHNFDIRKQLLDYDDVANDQRTIIYQQRTELMKLDDISEEITHIRRQVVESIVQTHVPPQSMEEQWNIAGLQKQVDADLRVNLDLAEFLEKNDGATDADIQQYVFEAVDKAYHDKENDIGAALMRPFEKSVMLQSVDTHWREHLLAMDHLRQGIHLRGYAQKNPKQEYKRESFELFSSLLNAIKFDVVSSLMTFQVQAEEDIASLENQRRQSVPNVSFEHAKIDMPAPDNQEETGSAPFSRETPKVGRNEPCPCGSSKKYKHCHGSL